MGNVRQPGSRLETGKASLLALFGICIFFMQIVCYLVMNQQNQPFQDLTVGIGNGSNNKDMSLLYSTYHKKPDKSILDKSDTKSDSVGS